MAALSEFSPPFTAGAPGHANSIRYQVHTDWTAPLNHLSAAARLDRLADVELAHGHEQLAVYLSARADALRAVGP